jgi:hypothetical protein
MGCADIGELDTVSLRCDVIVADFSALFLMR